MIQRRLSWVSLADQRPGREQYWLTRMPATRTTVLSALRPLEVPGAPVAWVPVSYRRPMKRFVEAGALAWVRGIERVPCDADWVASLECCSLITGQVAELVARRPGTRQAVLTWENDPRQPLYRVPMFRRALARTLAGASLFLCLARCAAEHLRVLGVPPQRIAVVHPGIDLVRFRPAPTPATAPVIAFVSPLVATKGIDRLLAAMPLVRSQVRGAQLRVMGSGPLEHAVLRAAQDPGTGVEYVGSGDADAVAELLRGAAVFSTAPRANAKWAEQFGLAYLEAMACGLPIVTTATGTNDEALGPGNIRTVDRTGDLAAALVSMLRDPVRRHDLGAANRAHVECHHDIEVQSTRMAQAFTAAEALPPRRPRPRQ